MALHVNCICSKSILSVHLTETVTKAMHDIQSTPFFFQNIKNNLIAGMWLFIGSRRSLDWVAPTPLQLLFWGVAG